MKHLSFTIVLLLFATLTLNAQTKKSAGKEKKTEQVKTSPDSLDRAFEARINVQAKYFGDSIVLRWAPETAGAWREVARYARSIAATLACTESRSWP